MMKDLAMIAQLMRGRDPQSVALSMIKNNKIDNPQINQLVQFAQNGDTNSLVNLATDMFKQRGLNIDEEFNAFLSLLK